jgi:thiosulfate reductase cytochrome b subunit
LTAVDIYVSVVAMLARGARLELVLAFIIGICLLMAYLVADGFVGHWRERRDAEEAARRQRAARNRSMAIRSMSQPIKKDRVFPADRRR